MNIDTTITIDTLLNTGLALLGWFYIMFSEKPPRTLAQCGRGGKAEKPEGL